MNMVFNDHVSSKARIRQELSRETGFFKVHREERRGP